jgi:mannose-6-phosphate isomerase
VGTDHRPVLLGPNYIPQGYSSGGGVARFRGGDTSPQSCPEDWVGSVTARWQREPAGFTRLPGGRYLKDAVERDPVAYLGPEHVASFGADPGLLVKLLDGANRLSVHLHPDDHFASRHLGCAHGKTEAWVVLSTTGEGKGYLGFKREIDTAELAGWVAGGSNDALLAALNSFPLTEGMALLVPAGVPHALGPGVLILELQQPTDLSIVLERRPGVGGDLGLGWDLALQAVDRSAWSHQRLQLLFGAGLSSTGRVLPGLADPFFRAVHVSGRRLSQIEQSFAIVVGLEGSGELAGDYPGPPVTISRGSTILLPFAAGPVSLVGDAEAVVCTPPRPG